MAYYNTNEIVRLTRIAVGLSQEELCDGICDVSTLSRMENGHHAVKRDTYKKLMEKMGRKAEMRYAVCIDKEGKLLERRLEMERAFMRYDYAAAEEAFQYMKAHADENVLTNQYFIRVEAWIDYYCNQISMEKVAERVDRAIRMTAPDYEKFIGVDKVFPFMLEELLAIMNLGSVYRAMECREKSVALYKTVLACLEAKYMGEDDNITMQISVRNNLARNYFEMGMYKQSLQEVETCIQMSRERDYSYQLDNLLVLKAYLIGQLVKKGEREKELCKEAKKNLRQAYYLAAARRDEKTKTKIKRYYMNYLGQFTRNYTQTTKRGLLTTNKG